MDKLVHYCVDEESGTKCETEIEYYDILYDMKCHICGEPLVPNLVEVVAHMYEELTNESSDN